MKKKKDWKSNPSIAAQIKTASKVKKKPLTQAQIELKKKLKEHKEKLEADFCNYLGTLLNAKVISEYKFFPSRRWRIDFYITKGSVKIALEVEGGIWIKGRHITPEGFLKDMEKYNALSACGITLVRCVPDDCKVKTKYISAELLNTLKKILN
jgi:hypothetical protein